MSSEFPISIQTASGHPREERTATELAQLINDHDLSGLQWTDRVVVQFMAGAHSHPVLTVNTRHTGAGLLAVYIHEQMHWWVGEHPGLGPAIEDSKSLWPEVPDQDGGGSRTEFSTRLHLAVCHLEHRALEHLVGLSSASSLLDEQIHDSPSYPWIREQVKAHGSELDGLCSTHGLWPTSLTPAF